MACKADLLEPLRPAIPFQKGEKEDRCLSHQEPIMSTSLSRMLRSRTTGIFLYGLTLTPLAGCHHRSAVPAEPSPAENVTVGDGEEQVRNVKATAPGAFAVVVGLRDYATAHDVPAAWQHLVDWHAGAEPVVLLFSAGGRACAVTPWQAARVVTGQRYSCIWKASH